MKLSFLPKAWLMIVIALVGLTVNSCKKEKSKKTDSPQAKGTITASALNVKGYELISLAVDNLVLDKTEYEVEVGDKKIKAVKNLDNSLTIMVPADVPNGNYVLKAAFASNTVNLNIVMPAPLADPVLTMETAIGDLAAMTAQIKQLSGEATLPQYVTDSKAAIDAAILRFKQLPAAEKQIAAQFMEANSAALNQVQQHILEFGDLSANFVLGKTGAASVKGAPCDGYCILAQAIKVSVAFVAVVAGGVTVGPWLAAGLALEISVSVLTGKRSIIAAGIVATYRKGNNFTFIPGFDSNLGVLDAADKSITGGIETQTITGIKIARGKPFSFKLSPIYRNIQRSDAESTRIPLAAPFVAAYDKAKAAVEKYFPQAGAFPSFTIKKEKIAAASLADWEIKVTSGSVTATTPAGAPNNFSVVFNSSVNEQQNFAFEMRFKGRYETIAEQVTATLMPLSAADYTLELYDKVLTSDPTKNYPDNVKETIGDLVNTVVSGDILKLPRGTTFYYKVKYKGSYVKLNAKGDLAETRQFFSSKIPLGAADGTDEAFTTIFTDYTNNVEIKMPLKLTLSNDLYRLAVNKTIEIKTDGASSTTVVTLQLKENGVLGGSLPQYTYSLVNASYSRFVKDCSTYNNTRSGFRGAAVNKKLLGEILFDFKGGNPHGIPSSLFIFEDGTGSELFNCFVTAAIK